MTVEEREKAERRHVEAIISRFAPNFLIHTAGLRLAAIGDRDFLMQYGKRRSSLCDKNIEALQGSQILADDHYGIVRAVFRSSRGDKVWERVGLGAWRFENGLAVQHWELGDAEKWDEFFISGDPDFAFQTGREFWLKA